MCSLGRISSNLLSNGSILGDYQKTDAGDLDVHLVILVILVTLSNLHNVGMVTWSPPYLHSPFGDVDNLTSHQRTWAP